MIMYGIVVWMGPQYIPGKASHLFIVGFRHLHFNILGKTVTVALEHILSCSHIFLLNTSTILLLGNAFYMVLVEYEL